MSFFFLFVNLVYRRWVTDMFVPSTETVLLSKSKKHEGALSDKVSRSYRLWYNALVGSMPHDCPYTVVHTENLVGLFTCIFVRNSEKAALKDVAITTVKRGMGGRYGNKVRFFFSPM